MSEKLSEITEGSFLRVNEEGKAYWGQSEGGGGGATFIVNVTVADDGATCTADKTFAEMEEAYLSGKVVKVVETRTLQGTIWAFVYDLSSYISVPQKGLSFVNVQPGATNFRFNAIDFMEDSAYKTVYTMTGTFA